MHAGEHMGDTRKPAFADLIDLANVRRMVVAHNRTSGVTTGIVDAETGEIYAEAGWQRICTAFHRVHPETSRLCTESDTAISANLRRGEAYANKCRNGLWDIGIPAYCLDDHIATVFLGQFFYEGEVPDRDFFVRRARRLGLDEADYLAALDEVPVLSRARVDAILEYNKALAASLTSDATKTELLRRSRRNEVQALLDSSTESAFLVDRDGVFVAVNEVTAARLSRRPEELLGTCAFDMLAPELAASRRQLIEDVFATQEPTRFIDERDGRILDNSVQPVVDAEGVTQNVAVFVRDISEQQRAARARPRPTRAVRRRCFAR